MCGGHREKGNEALVEKGFRKFCAVVARVALCVEVARSGDWVACWLAWRLGCGRMGARAGGRVGGRAGDSNMMGR